VKCIKRDNTRRDQRGAVDAAPAGMLSVRSSAHLRLSPTEVWALLHDMERHYLAWHPDHLGWVDVRGHVTEPGSIIFADERVGRLRLRCRFFIDEVVPLRRIAFHLGFPFNLLNAGGWFELEPTAHGGCRLTSETHVGGRTRLGAAIVDPVVRWVLPPETLERHMREEGEGLERLSIRGEVLCTPATGPVSP
jgi:hypothetical protein